MVKTVNQNKLSNIKNRYKYINGGKNIKHGGKKDKMKYILIIIYLILTVSGLILYKKGTNSDFLFIINNNSLSIKLSLVSILGLVCYLMSFLMYMLILPKFDLTFIYPLMSAISYVSIYILSILILNESVTTLGVIGSLIIVVGIFIVNVGK